ncbi:hypothetical protein F511_46046 [Dorcoceras hygrometricum]|uniref:Secreted protein n=1 Tax=Dorcoceras hygrometricum TaxID=472368 RepID=A0A2Z7A1V4_9LAMI|nr:hypothetical protein F511_46046 [Dorcoceras hygrometricum]
MSRLSCVALRGCVTLRGCVALVAAARPLRCAQEFVVAAAGRPPLRRCSADVVTAGLISSRVWFGPVPGSP